MIEYEEPRIDTGCYLIGRQVLQISCFYDKE